VTTVSAQFANQNGCWTYDAFGNRTMEAYSTLSSTPCAPGANDNAQLTVTAQSSANNNQVAGITQYDPAGEVTYDGSNYYRYDGEGRLCAVDNLATGGLTQYIYDAGGARVAKGSLTSWPASCGAPGTNGFTLTSQYLLDLSGEQVTELNGAGTWQHSNAFEGGRLTATYDQNGLHFAIADPLGTKRVQALITTAGGATLDENCFSLPFGNNIGNSRQTNCQGPGVDATEHHFTGKERDTESGNDYFGARYYSSAMGRWMSPDWAAKAMPVPYANLLDPQSLNLYAYVNNNPLLKADPDGHCDWCQKVANKLSGNGWKTDEQVAQKGINNNVVLVRTGMVDGAKVGDLKGVFHVTYTPTKIENGELKGPVSADPKDPNVKVSLWESQGGGSYENMDPKSGPSVGQGHDNISTGMGMLSPDVDQHWSVNGERVQMVVGTDSQTGKPILTWQDHVDRSGDTPKITGVPNAKP
jgi:RHS repeat-associated protein